MKQRYKIIGIAFHQEYKSIRFCDTGLLQILAAFELFQVERGMPGILHEKAQMLSRSCSNVRRKFFILFLELSGIFYAHRHQDSKESMSSSTFVNGPTVRPSWISAKPCLSESRASAESSHALSFGTTA